MDWMCEDQWGSKHSFYRDDNKTSSKCILSNKVIKSVWKNFSRFMVIYGICVEIKMNSLNDTS